MGLKKYLKNRIRGWLPKESSQPSNKVKVTEAPTKALKIIWYVVVIAILMVIVAAVIVFYIPFLAENLVNRTIVLVIYAVGAVALYVAFGRDYYKRHQKERRVRIIVGSGLFTAFAVSVTLSLLLGPLPSYFWISFILLFAIGAFVGNLIMKKLEGHNLEATN
jgi:amino acid transporter